MRLNVLTLCSGRNLLLFLDRCEIYAQEAGKNRKSCGCWTPKSYQCVYPKGTGGRRDLSPEPFAFRCSLMRRPSSVGGPKRIFRDRAFAKALPNYLAQFFIAKFMRVIWAVYFEKHFAIGGG
jgi:hypothetical protein